MPGSWKPRPECRQKRRQNSRSILDPYQPPKDSAEVRSPLEDLAEIKRIKRLRSFTGNYFIVLGWLSVAATVISLVTVFGTDHLHIDLSFILLFWLGKSLKKGIPAARLWAISIFFITGLFSVLLSFLPDSKANIGKMEYEKTEMMYWAIICLIVLSVSIPGIVLLGKRGREAFSRTIPEEPFSNA